MNPMNDEFKRKCKRRTAVESSIELEGNPGGGCGGGPDAPGPEDGGHTRYFDGTYAIAANQFQLTTRPAIPPAIPDDYLISLLSAGMGMDGRVEIGASQG